jgi:hypothetical protein
MVESLGRMRQVLIAAVALGSVGLGWVMLWHITPPGVATNLQTSILTTVVALQVLPVLAWFAWRADREVSAEAAPRSAAPDAGREAARPAVRDSVRSPDRPGEVLAVHRVVHVPRAKPGRVHGPHVGGGVGGVGGGGVGPAETRRP